MQKQVSTEQASWFLVFLVVLALALWAPGKLAGYEHGVVRRWSVKLAAFGMVVFAAIRLVPTKAAPMAKADTKIVNVDDPVVMNGKIAWVPYNAKRIEMEHNRKRPIFLDFTADWCSSCKANDVGIIETESVRNALVKTNILPMKADWTNQDEEIEKKMHELGRSALPIYVVLYPDGSKELLPVVITQGMLIEAFENAAKKFPPAKTGI